MNSSSCELKNNLYELLNCALQNVSTGNPIDYFERMYDSVNPGMIMSAVDEAKKVIRNFKAVGNKESCVSSEPTQNANVFITMGGDSLNQSFYDGIIATLLWLPEYLKEIRSRIGVSEADLTTPLNVLKEAKLPQLHDVKEKTIDRKKVEIKPSSVKHYAAFLGSIVSWLAEGVSHFQIKGPMKSNLELVRYLGGCATKHFPSIPFAAYYIGNVSVTQDKMFELSEKLGKSFKWTDYMTNESYTLNEPKFVVTSEFSPIVGIIGHPLSETFIAEVKEGKTKWIGMFVESEEFSKICAKNGLTSDMIKKYIIATTPEQHVINLSKKHHIAEFIEKQSITKQCFEWRHKYKTVNMNENDDDEYDV